MSNVPLPPPPPPLPNCQVSTLSRQRQPAQSSNCQSSLNVCPPSTSGGRYSASAASRFTTPSSVSCHTAGRAQVVDQSGCKGTPHQTSRQIVDQGGRKCTPGQISLQVVDQGGCKGTPGETSLQVVDRGGCNGNAGQKTNFVVLTTKRPINPLASSTKNRFLPSPSVGTLVRGSTLSTVSCLPRISECTTREETRGSAEFLVDIERGRALRPTKQLMNDRSAPCLAAHRNGQLRSHILY